jgi:hypothetical protein
MRIINAVFTKQLLHEGNRTITSGADSGFTSKTMLSSEEQTSIRGGQVQQSVESLEVDFLINWRGECRTTVKQFPMASMPITSTSREHGGRMLMNPM